MFDDDIPAPSKGKGRAKYNLKGIQVGQSKWFEFQPESVENIHYFRMSLVSSANYANREVSGIKFSTALEKSLEGKDGIRIWRVE